MSRISFRSERAQALPITLAALFVLSLTTAAVLTGAAINHRNAKNSADGKRAFALAEQGLAYAEGRLYSGPDTAESVLVPGTTVTPREGDGSITYSGTLCDDSTTPSCSPKVWTLYSTGSVNAESRTVSAQVTIPSVTQTVDEEETSTSTDLTIWHYIYLNGSSCTSLSGNLTIDVPMYTQGCLNLSGNVKYIGSDLEVAGSLSVTGNAQIGKNVNQRIAKMAVHGACSPAAACATGAQSPIFVNPPGVQTTLSPTLSKPGIDLSGTYSAANPGPATGHACPAGSNVPSHFFDNDTVLNDSNGNINLFPSGTSYDCKVGSNEIKWDGSSHLTVNGGFYFDGNLALSGNSNIVYSGEGTLYFTGTYSQSGNLTLCAVSGCSANSWDTTKNVLILVAGCQNASGGAITSGCVSMSGNTTLQAGIYAGQDYSISGNAVNQGPVIAENGSFSGNASQFIPLQSVPDSAPQITVTSTTTTEVTTTVDGTPQPPSHWNG